MPHYYDANGQMVDAAVATLPDGRTKPGYSEVLAPGERMHVSIISRDSAPGLFLTDQSAQAPSIDKAWREYVGSDGHLASGTRHPQDWASHFKRFAEAFAASVGAEGLAAVAGVSATEKPNSDADAGDAAYQRSKKALNDWRADPPAPITDAAPAPPRWI